MNRDKAFTLIELLVVIAVIALLLAILVPALQVAKRQAEAVVCLANLNGLSKCWYLYANDNDAQIVGGGISLTPLDEWSPGEPMYCWVCEPQTESGQSRYSGSTVDEELIGIRRGLLFTYAEAYGVYHCPGDKRYKDAPLVDGWGGAGGYRSYSIAGGMFGVNPGGSDYWLIVPHKKLTEIKSPGDKYVFVEEMDGRGYNMGSWVVYPTGDQWVDPLAIWHNEKSTLGFADGHAEKHIWRDQETIDMAENQTFYAYAPNSEDLWYMQTNYAYWKLYP
jgi:prepilin-type N-terminal cleavage/methylation domain-containing protein/prepilin-type processing-associated H-X9-DG protein